MHDKKNVFPLNSRISYEQRKEMMNQEPFLVWFTGLSGAGKSTLALRLEHYLFHEGYKVYLLDGDNVRNGLNRDLSFTKEDRKENVRRVGEVANLMLDAGLIVLGAFISPYQAERELVKKTVGAERYKEVYINCSLDVCESRDTKGLYAKARQGEVANFTGISAPYESPGAPDLEINTDLESVEESLCRLVRFLNPLLKEKTLEKVTANNP